MPSRILDREVAERLIKWADDNNFSIKWKKTKENSTTVWMTREQWYIWDDYCATLLQTINEAEQNWGKDYHWDNISHIY